MSIHQTGSHLPHVHVHIVPRREVDSDSSPNNLHGKIPTDDKEPRGQPHSQEELSAEATLYRNSMRSI
ncbi:hypothetical protein COOONC_05292 [Cooperia oncophora]